MNVLTFDVETTHKHKPNGSTTALPYFGNSLVSVGYKWLHMNTISYHCYYHYRYYHHELQLEETWGLVRLVFMELRLRFSISSSNSQGFSGAAARWVGIRV